MNATIMCRIFRLAMRVNKYTNMNVVITYSGFNEYFKLDIYSDDLLEGSKPSKTFEVWNIDMYSPIFSEIIKTLEYILEVGKLSYNY